MNESTNPTATAETADPNTVVLETPLQRGDQQITSIHLRKPNSGELRGLKLQDLLQTEVTSLATLLPRISTPTLTAADVNNLDPVDLVSVATVVVHFFLSKAQREFLPA